MYTVSQVSKIMKVRNTDIYKWVKSGLPYYKTTGGRLRFDILEVVTWCDRIL